VTFITVEVRWKFGQKYETIQQKVQ